MRTGFNGIGLEGPASISRSTGPALSKTHVKSTTINAVAVLRVADRFTVSDAGRVVEQENHFDPRDLTNPGWAKE